MPDDLAVARGLYFETSLEDAWDQPLSVGTSSSSWRLGSGLRSACCAPALNVSGDLTLHGVTRPVTLPIQLEQKGDMLTAAGKMTVKQTDYGIEPTSAAGGLVKVENEVVLSFHITAKAAP